MTDKESVLFVPSQDVSCTGNGFSDEDRRKIPMAYFSMAMREAREKKLGKVTNKHFTTVFHDSVYKELIKMFVALRDGDFEDKTGIFTKILLGPRGIAKTTCLRNFISTAPLLSTGVAALLLSYTSEGSLPEELEKQEVTSVCAKIKRCFEWSTERNPDETYPDFIVRSLAENKTKLILVVDEVDQLFKAGEHDSIFYEFAHKSLSELAVLGNNTSGRLMIILSGSSSRLRSFVKGASVDFSDQEKADYKLLSRNLNMNSNRYKTLRAIYPRPDSILDALAILHPSDDFTTRKMSDFQQDMIEAARARMFARGCNPRELDDQISTANESVVPFLHPYRKLWMQLLLLWYGDSINRKLLVILGKRKQSFRDRILSRELWSPYVCDACKGTACPHATSKWEWEKQFKPISLSTMYNSRGPELACQLDRLQYEGYIVLIDEHIYPASLELYVENLKCWATSLSQLVRRRISLFCTSPEDQLSFVDGLSARAKDLIYEALRNGASKIYT